MFSPYNWRRFGTRRFEWEAIVLGQAVRGRAREIAQEIAARLESLPVKNTPSVRALRREYSRVLRTEAAEFILAIARELLARYGYRMVPYELIQAHPGAFHELNADRLEELGRGIDSWHAVDAFARTLSGPAWREGLISDRAIRRWARSEDRWWRRAALVSTVALNVRSEGGMGDTRRTLAICGLLAHDRDEMVAEALSWALRELAPHDPASVRRFLRAHGGTLVALVTREVNNKLETGLKNPRRAGKGKQGMPKKTSGPTAQ